MSRSIFCAGVGPRIQVYSVNNVEFSLELSSEVPLQGSVQYACQSRKTDIFYAAVSNGGPRVAGDTHSIVAFEPDAENATLIAHGRPAPLRSRPVHISIDANGHHLLVAYHKPAGISVHRLNDDGTVGPEVLQDASLDLGIYPHQILTSPGNDVVILSSRGNDPTDGRPEDPGALKVFDYDEGRLKSRSSVSPNGGFSFGPRNIAFHPEKPWVYVALERQNKLYVFELRDGTLQPEPLFIKETLEDPLRLFHKQVVGAIGFHPEKNVLYVVNRGGPHNPAEVHIGGENSIAVFRLDPESGEPQLAQHIQTTGNRPRTFSINPEHNMMVVGNMQQRLLADGKVVPPGLAVFEVLPSGLLEFRRRYDVEVGSSSLFWSGFVRANNA